MNWTELLKSEIESTYRSTANLMDMVDNDRLDWKPESGQNWMTTGQLLRHLTDACGGPCRGFVTGDWGIPPEAEVSADEMLPPAEKFPTIASVAEAKALLDKDRRLALDMLALTDESRLANEMVTAPWSSTPSVLGRQILDMIIHLKQHKSQLFYYLKLQGKPVHTGHLWG